MSSLFASNESLRWKKTSEAITLKIMAWHIVDMSTSTRWASGFYPSTTPSQWSGTSRLQSICRPKNVVRDQNESRWTARHGDWLSNKVIDEISLKKSDREKSVMSTFIPTFPVNWCFSGTLCLAGHLTKLAHDQLSSALLLMSHRQQHLVVLEVEGTSLHFTVSHKIDPQQFSFNLSMHHWIFIIFGRK